MRPRARALALAAALLLAPRPSHAEDAALEQGRALFEVGAQAYAKADYGAAIQAFEEAYRLTPRPGVTFSLAQAHRRQYLVTKRGEHLQAAMKRYREYLDKVPQGGRRSEVVDALAELSRSADAEPARPAAEPAPPTDGGETTSRRTRLMVSSRTAGATVAVDGGKGSEAPLVIEVEPGKHRVRVAAEGFAEEEREVVAVEGGVLAVDLTLRERPARVTVLAPAGARISIDGRLVGVAPLARPIEHAPGRRVVTVTKSGFRYFHREVELGRGAASTVSADLEPSGQRIAAFVVGGGAAVAGAVGALFAAGAMREQGIAAAILSERESAPITKEQRIEYERAKDARDEHRRLAGGALGAAAALGVTSLLLFVFDEPETPVLSPRGDDERPGAPRPSSPAFEMSATPAYAPGYLGASVTGRWF